MQVGGQSGESHSSTTVQANHSSTLISLHGKHFSPLAMGLSSFLAGLSTEEPLDGPLGFTKTSNDGPAQVPSQSNHGAQPGTLVMGPPATRSDTRVDGSEANSNNILGEPPQANDTIASTKTHQGNAGGSAKGQSQKVLPTKIIGPAGKELPAVKLFGKFMNMVPPPFMGTTNGTSKVELFASVKCGLGDVHSWALNYAFNPARHHCEVLVKMGYCVVTREHILTLQPGEIPLDRVFEMFAMRLTLANQRPDGPKI
ncbi:hypothetical protein PIB30_035436 [Stylosanthes scabra]|uniref:Uncharacterized protein n=1 Tax=Stylosanthes scabra TaxID=79078 RepID=A0ABU6SD36_9FABA|nr:hypothetical protein [Stylosanthes scabra]